LRRDKSILYSRVAIAVLLYSAFTDEKGCDEDSRYNSGEGDREDEPREEYKNAGLGLYGGLFHVTNVTQMFQGFIFIISAIILQLTAFYPRKV
jgi:NADH-ubiquinone oxidoreductase chain 2